MGREPANKSRKTEVSSVSKQQREQRERDIEYMRKVIAKKKAIGKAKKGR